MNMTNITDMIEIAQQFNMTAVDVFGAVVQYKEVSGNAGLILGIVFILVFIAMVIVTVSKYEATEDDSDLLKYFAISAVTLLLLLCIFAGMHDCAVSLYASDYAALKEFMLI